MPRKATKHTQIQSEKERISTFKRRLDSLLKKARELSILCGIKIAIVIHNPNDGYSMLWPSEDVFMSLTEKFLSVPEREMVRKMVLQEKFLIDEAEDKVLQSLKLKQNTIDKEIKFCMYQINDDSVFESLDLNQLSGLYSFANEKLKELEKRSNELQGIISDSNGGILEQQMENNRIIEASNYGLQDNFATLGANEWSGSMFRGNHGEVSDVFHQDWTSYFGH